MVDRNKVSSLWEYRWRQIAPHIRRQILSNVFCGNCQETTMVDYTVQFEAPVIVLRGKCKFCGGVVVRVVDPNHGQQ